MSFALEQRVWELERRVKALETLLFQSINHDKWARPEDVERATATTPSSTQEGTERRERVGNLERLDELVQGRVTFEEYARPVCTECGGPHDVDSGWICPPRDE